MTMRDMSREAAMTAAERKSAQRRRDKSRGMVEIVVRVPEDRVEEVRDWCSKLKPKRKKRDMSQTDMFTENRDMSLDAEGGSERSGDFVSR